ncbi:MAG: hypothetical protein E7647_03865 [Ruminococcaceae bacterium]|nr:hypothetical protein [Oscillospiraceae bacterium]
MKKLISYLLIFAILVGCMASAAAVSAVDVTLAAESVEKVEGSGTAVAPKLTIAGNPGLSYVRLVVYYDSSELALGDTADSLADSVFSADDSEVSKEYAGTHRNVRDHIPEELRDMSNGFFVELCGAGEETVYGDGIAVEIPFEIIASDPGEFNYTVAVAEALDADGNDIALEGVSAAVSYVADPLTGIHDEFTVFMDPAIAEVTVGTTSIDVDIRLDQNPGLWATRIYIVYPEALTLADADGNARVENSFMIFEGAGEMLPGLPDLALDDPRQPATFEKVMRSDPSIVKEGYHSTTVYFESETVDTVADADGVLCTLSFSVSDSVKDGDALDISMYYGDSDFLYAYTDDGTGFPVFVEYSPAVIGSDITFVSVICDHVEGDAIITDPTCTEPGMIVHKCTLCGLIVRREYISATGHDRNGDVVTVEPTCVKDGTKTTYCSICGEVSAIEIIEALGSHTPGADATCTEPQLCLVCSSVIKAPLGHTEGEAVVIEPTCTLEGEETFYCTVCSVHTRTEIIPPKGHTVILGTCTVCGETELVPRELIYTVSNGAVTVTGYTGEESKLYIPATIEGYPVSTVADTLYKSSSIKSIYLSENIESLVLSVSGSAKLESLYISGADTTIRIQGSYTSSSGISNVFYAGTLAEYSSNMGAVNYFTNVICNYGTPMEGFIFTTDEDARSITVTGYTVFFQSLLFPLNTVATE